MTAPELWIVALNTMLSFTRPGDLPPIKMPLIPGWLSRPASSFKIATKLKAACAFTNHAFQSDLWLLNFAEQTEPATLVELPAFPSVPEQSLSDGQESLEITIDETDLENFFIGNPNAIAQVEEEQPSPLQQSSYPLSSLWVFDQSKRLEEQQSYYLDHPKMGILVTIKSHEVEITNPLEEIEPELETAALTSNN
jgi:hypothetical protein